MNTKGILSTPKENEESEHILHIFLYFFGEWERIPTGIKGEDTYTISVYRSLHAGNPKWHLIGENTRRSSGSGPLQPTEEKKLGQ